MFEALQRDRQRARLTGQSNREVDDRLTGGLAAPFLTFGVAIVGSVVGRCLS